MKSRINICCWREPRRNRRGIYSFPLLIANSGAVTKLLLLFLGVRGGWFLTDVGITTYAVGSPKSKYVCVAAGDILFLPRAIPFSYEFAIRGFSGEFEKFSTTLDRLYQLCALRSTDT